MSTSTVDRFPGRVFVEGTEWEVFKVKGNSFRFRNKRTAKITRWFNFNKALRQIEPFTVAMDEMGKAAAEAASNYADLAVALRGVGVQAAPDEAPVPMHSGSAEGVMIRPAVHDEWNPEDFDLDTQYRITFLRNGEYVNLIKSGKQIKTRLDTLLALRKDALTLRAASTGEKITSRMTKWDLAVIAVRGGDI